MTIKAKLKDLASRGIFRLARQVENASRDRHSVDLVLEQELRRSDTAALHYPVLFVELLRSCIEGGFHSVREVKSAPHNASPSAHRFSRLLDAFHGPLLPPVDIETARGVAMVADRNAALTDAYDVSREGWAWSGDVGLNFSFCSSFGSKGRILYNIVRFMRSESCLELGTAYGMSAFFILAALEKYSKAGRLTTIEGEQPQFALSSSAIQARFGARVACQFGYTDAVLPELFKTPGQYDFIFHDSTHTGESYVQDFARLSPRLAPGSVFLFDDIRWDSVRYAGADLHTYEGWLSVVSNPRVRRAVEIDDALGLLFIE